MQQASNISSHSAIRRAAQIIVVMLALAVMVFASCMMVTAGDKLAALTQSDQGQGTPQPGPTVPEPAT
jgi:hypothetical protein